jgi:hypothetical protein
MFFQELIEQHRVYRGKNLSRSLRRLSKPAANFIQKSSELNFSFRKRNAPEYRSLDQSFIFFGGTQNGCEVIPPIWNPVYRCGCEAARKTGLLLTLA